jgi:prophage regulatory protein
MRILRKGAAAAKTGYSKSHLDRLARLGLFPKKVQLGPAAVGYLEDEADRWLAERVAERDEEPRGRRAG